MGGKLATIQNRKQYTMKWVKASERLPEHHNEVCVKYKGQYCNGNRNYNSGNPKMILFLPSDLITTRDCEWLDESDSGEQVRKLREGLEGIGKSLYIGDDLKDKEVLDFYVEVVKNCKEYIKLLLTETEG